MLRQLKAQLKSPQIYSIEVDHHKITDDAHLPGWTANTSISGTRMLSSKQNMIMYSFDVPYS